MIRQGITVAGNLIVDYYKQVPVYPGPVMLAHITGVTRTLGGSVPNVIRDLAALTSDLPLTAVGCVGKDDAGALITDTLKNEGIDTSFISRVDTPTSYTDCMCAADTGERTFFTYSGANAVFSPEYVPLDKLNSRILHIAYLLLLDAFDAPDPEYGTVMARFLKSAQQSGLKTSIDCVSASKGRFPEVVKPALKYCDYVILNEIEACSVWEMEARDENGALNEKNIKAALESFIREGVREMAVIHCPEAGYSLDAQGVFTKVPSFKLPEGFIKSSVGAGDAFCAGCLYKLYYGAPADEMLRFAAACAAASLSAPDAVSGLKRENEINKLINSLEMR